MSQKERRNHILRGLLSAVDRLGSLGIVLGFPCLVITISLVLRLTLGWIENRPTDLLLFVNLVVVNGSVSLPIALYLQRLVRQLVSLHAVRNDLTSQLSVALHRAEDANKAKSAFLANMSHELRTPLNAIIGFSEIMRDQHLMPLSAKRQSEYAGDIHESGQHLLAIINDILDLSKIEAGAMRLDDAKAFALKGAIEASLRIVAPIAKRQKIELISEFANMEISVLGVERMVRQILINIITNAVKFTPQGGKVYVKEELDSRNAVTIVITDTGVGMSDEDIVKALLPFSQVSNAMSNKHKGTGLGLPLAKAMLELHGGVFSITSVPFEGTSVSLSFPQDRVRYEQTPLPLEASSGLRQTA
jgi:signal transduction histidine kinase